MAAPLETSRHQHGDWLFIAALLLSIGVHGVLLYLMPKPTEETPPATTALSVELLPPPKPVQPPEPPKPRPEPEKDKPKPQPKKPLPPQSKPQPIPAPHVVEAPLHQMPEPEPVRPSQPAVIAAPPPAANEPPREFVAPTPPPEPPPRVRGPSDQDMENARGNYSNLLSREFAKYKQYPRLAQMRGWQGTVKVELHMDANGKLLNSAVIESSNFDVLDRQALEMVRKASPLPPPPDVLRGRDFTIVVPVVFRLE